MNRVRLKYESLQWLRLTSLLAVVLFFVFVPLSNWYANNKMAFNSMRLVDLAEGSFKGQLYHWLDSFYSLWDDPIKAATSNNGSLWAYTIMGIPISDPLGLLSELINSVKFPIKYLIGAIIPYIIAIIFGRVFCSWFCPMALFFGINTRLRAITNKLKIPLLDLKVPDSTRYFLFLIGLVCSALWGAWVWHFILPYITFSHEIFSYITFASFTVGIYFFIGILLLDFAVAPGEFCRAVCPTGLLLTWLSRFRLIRLQAAQEHCPKYCVQCQNQCPVDLYPRYDQKLDACHLCLKCVRSCPKDLIKLKPLGFKRHRATIKTSFNHEVVS